MSFQDKIKQELENTTGKSTEELKDIIMKNKKERYNVSKKIMDFVREHPSLTSSIVEEAIDVPTGRIRDYTYVREKRS